MKHKLFVGITSWNSELLLQHCIESVKKTTKGLAVEIAVLDNCSQDASAKIASQQGVTLISKQCSQADALNKLFHLSSAEYTLLIHADVILLSPDWFDVCTSYINTETVMVSPEDIGCGPLTRPFGLDKPESSFMFFHTEAIKIIRKWHFKKLYKCPIFANRKLDFYGLHITHSLPEQLQAKNKRWQAMRVLHSNIKKQKQYKPSFQPEVWAEELEYLQYGLGNFYALNGIITHYHNWYDRLYASDKMKKLLTTEQDGKGFPVDFIKNYTNRFLCDYKNKQLELPDVNQQVRQPKSIV